MGKASTSKKVARAARTGGGRTRRGSSTSSWPIIMGLIVALGVAGIVFSKQEVSADTGPPRAKKDHWHAAYGVDICGKFAPPITDQTDPVGIHTHGDGVIHTHPFRPTVSGKHATLGAFLSSVKATVTSSEIHLPGQKTQKTCAGKPATVMVKVWRTRSPDDKGAVAVGPPSKVRIRNGALITIALVPKAGSRDKGKDIPRPPTAGALDKLNDVSPPTPPPTPAPGVTTTPGATTPAGATPPPASSPEAPPPTPAPSLPGSGPPAQK